VRTSESYLPAGLPSPEPSDDGLDRPYWDGLRNEQLVLQRCRSCATWQWGPEFICHRCHSFDLGHEATSGQGVIYSHQRVWHPVHPALADRCPYIIVLVELPAAGGVRLVGNLLGDPRQRLEIGAAVTAVSEHHDDPPHTLLQWALIP
jgi:uncharacterized OB-fold protein